MTGPKTQHSKEIRPTSDRVREALFSILGSRIENASILDLFAGTGSLGLEGLSRGAAKAVFIDQSSFSLELIRKNLHHSLDPSRVKIMQLRADKEFTFNRLKSSTGDHLPFDIVFLDPPYERNLALQTLKLIEKAHIVADTGWVVAEERSRVTLPDSIGELALSTQRKYGETGIWIYKHHSAPPPCLH